MKLFVAECDDCDWVGTSDGGQDVDDQLHKHREATKHGGGATHSVSNLLRLVEAARRGDA